MMDKLILFALLALAPISVQAGDKDADRIAQLITSTDGSTKEKAFEVRSVGEEYAILAALKLRVKSQALVVGKDGHAYDMLTATDPMTGKDREIWFDIKSFYGKGF